MHIIWKFCIGFFIFCSMLHTQEYLIDNTHSSVSFSIKHLSVAPTIGHFQDFDGILDIEHNQIKNLKGNVVIASINTYNAARDEELLAKDFFHSKEATLQSLSFQNNLLRTILTINNISKEVTFKVKITGPIRNPSLILKEKNQEKNPLVTQPTNIPLSNPKLNLKTNDIDCGCYVSYGDNVIGVELIGSINRFDFNIAPQTPKELLGQDVDIRIILEASN